MSTQKQSRVNVLPLDDKDDFQRGPLFDGNKLKISDTGKYAYLAICSLSLAELFPNEWNSDFNSQYVKTLCAHLRAKASVETVMLALMEGTSGQNPQLYVTLLTEETALAGKAILVIQDNVLFAVRKGEYDARQRVLARRLAKLLNVPFDLIEFYEHSLVEFLNKDVVEHSKAEENETRRRDKKRKIKRYASVGIATIAGGSLIGLTGGLAAPFIGIGIGTILGGASAAAIASTTGVAIIGSIFGVAGAGLTGYKMNKRVGQVEEFGFDPLSRYIETDSQLHIAIAVTGWLKDENPGNVQRPWRCLAVSREQYALRYETKYLIELAQAFEYILSIAVSLATQEALKYTILSGLMAAVAWPAALLSMASVIDNPWSVCCRRSSEVGKQLAHVLLSRQHGKRPVTLVGFSLGARVIFYCLREMAEIGGGEGIVQDAIILGAPVTDKVNQWDKCCRVVAGEVINGYCRGDWLLRFLYRTLSISTGVAGLMALNCKKVTNVDLSGIISGHTEYYDKLHEVLKFVGLKTRETETLDADGVLKKSCSGLPQIGVICQLEEVNRGMQTSKSDTCLPTVSQRLSD